MVLHATTPKQVSPRSAARSAAADRCTLALELVAKRLLNNTFLRTHAPFRSLTFFDLGTD